MHPGLKELVELLNVEMLEENLFRGVHPKGKRGRLYGGQIMAQALVAAGRTVPTQRDPHSLHGYFLRPGDAKIPVVFSVDRIRDGRSFTTRRIAAIQHGQAIFSMDISFQEREQGLSHQGKMPAIERPDDSKITDKLKKEPFITYLMEYKQRLKEVPMAANQHSWFRTNGELDTDNNLIHAALLTFQSDDALLSTARLPHRGNFKREDMQSASLDHAMWFHSPARADQWILYALDAPQACASRGYNRGAMYQEDGTLVASTMQESLMRLRSMEPLIK
ncbi:MAG: acyl-CoA thioesterase II [bacterium]|nr:acyl-CoA thioesterase II [Gammaproteobacteria bacterium]HIL98353.1 acyl-CoA thioesterase II [Pseudomonadales bacterium]